jgi:hypothetical protein
VFRDDGFLGQILKHFFDVASLVFRGRGEKTLGEDETVELFNELGVSCFVQQ